MPSPAEKGISANDQTIGTKRKGNSGEMYVVVANSRQGKSWKKVSTPRVSVKGGARSAAKPAPLHKDAAEIKRALKASISKHVEAMVALASSLKSQTGGCYHMSKAFTVYVVKLTALLLATGNGSKYAMLLISPNLAMSALVLTQVVGALTGSVVTTNAAFALWNSIKSRFRLTKMTKNLTEAAKHVDVVQVAEVSKKSGEEMLLTLKRSNVINPTYADKLSKLQRDFEDESELGQMIKLRKAFDDITLPNKIGGGAGQKTCHMLPSNLISALAAVSRIK